MRCLVLALILQVLLIVPAARVHAGVAEASTTSDHILCQQYDTTGLSAKERDWFLTFIKGNILSEGWGQITADILKHTPAEDHEMRSHELRQLGTKIGREWCRDNKIRRIDSGMLSDWGGRLRHAAKHEPQQLPEVIRYIDVQVDSLLD